MLTSKLRQLHVRKVSWCGDLPQDIWGSGMHRHPPRTLMTWPCLECGTDVQTGLQFTVSLFLPAFGRIAMACAPDFSSSPPVLTVSWLEVSVFLLSARVLIKKLILTQPVSSSCCISDAWIFFLQLWSNKDKDKNTPWKTPSALEEFSTSFSLVRDSVGTGETA